MAYHFPDGLLRLKAFLGANGIRTSTLRDAHDVITVTNALFSLAFDCGIDDAESESIMDAQQSVIAAIGYENRRILVRQNLKSLPAKIVSMAPGNTDKRAGRMKARDRKQIEKNATAR